jgi:TolB-like protein
MSTLRTSRRAISGRLAATLAGVLLGVTAAPPLAAQTGDTRPTVAVMDFSNGAIGSARAELELLGGGIGDLLVAELAGNPSIRMVERKQVRRLLEEHGLTNASNVDAATAAKVGRMLGVQHMIFGGFVTDRSETMHLHARAVNVETGELVHVERVSDRIENFVPLVSSLATKMNAGMKLPSAPQRPASVGAAKSAKLPFEAVLLYSRAVKAEDAGDRAQAVELYSKVLGDFPTYTPARKALDRVAER